MAKTDGSSFTLHDSFWKFHSSIARLADSVRVAGTIAIRSIVSNSKKTFKIVGKCLYKYKIQLSSS